MKRSFSLLGFLLILFCSSCGVGTYTHSSGIDDNAYIVFTSNTKMELKVVIDGQEYQSITTVKPDYKTRRDLKNTAQNRIPVSVGKHDVRALSMDGSVIYDKKVFVSTTETKNIKL